MRVLVLITLVLLVASTAVSMAFEASGSLLQFSAGPISVNLFDLLLLLAAALLVREATLKRGQVIPPGNRTVLALVLGYCAYQVAVVLPVAVVVYGFEPISVTRLLENRVALMLIPFVYLVGLKYMTPQRLIDWVNAAAVCMALFALYNYATGGLGESAAEAAAGTYRLRELWGGATLLFGFLILTSLFLRRPNAVAYVMALVGLLGLALTNHRSGYVALIAIVPPLLINSRRIARRAFVVLLVAVTAVLLLLTASPTARDSVVYSLRTMVNPTADITARDRVDRSRLGWDYFVANPLGDYQWSQSYYLVDMGPGAFEPHNFVIQLLGQQGIVGFALFTGIMVVTARIAWRNRRKDRLSIVMLAYVAFYLVFCLFNTNLQNMNNILLLVVPVAVILDRNAALAESSEEEAHRLEAAVGSRASLAHG